VGGHHYAAPRLTTRRALHLPVAFPHLAMLAR
jgi:hypothetical protein